ncbi:carbamoyltransferase HypF [Acidihalobacter prosperus]|uniref:Carbamoyltransferase HypF n=1 Tax=Acidihalobacter prosperus TaxID=160660 RepID=A0A1A6C2N2_9GAMM|nr:carbamoyltransferase HypF [Acidihalobacter prosperus]OBS08821.1 [NiFe] hydrogenase metallocenter assembly protein HypF [Acidihalobacter prosperus]
MAAVRWVVGGRVQGVGYRPFVYRLAHRLGVAGTVRNGAGVVEIEAHGDDDALAAFAEALIAEAPAIARPQLLERGAPTAADDIDEGFRILPSRAGEAPRNHVPPDYFTCPDCLAELADPGNRRYRYPFINCAQCGPRYTLIRALPYDRAATTMAGFTLCPECRREYEDPLDRRFHAEPVACPTCGPQLAFVGGDERVAGNEAALTAAVGMLRAGATVAVKGIGGYHLLCDARNETAVARLRARKPRPHKPLAVLFAEDLRDLHRVADLSPAHEAALRAPERPIVLVPLRDGHGLAPSVCPGLNELGVLLPYSPLHHLLAADFDGPLVATSANPSGEPVLTDEAEAENRLADVADAFVHHNRPIERPADDSVLRVVAGRARPLRLGRGLTPLELELPQPLSRPLLAVGGHLKNTVALAWENRVVISPHLGDLDGPRARDLFARTIADLQRLYGVRAEAVACDAHPDYASTRWAAAQALPVHRVWHHHAHASAVAGEHPAHRRWLAFAWDGIGLGPDGALWGGEALYGAPGHWRRVGSLRPFRLPGAGRAGREPWRSAAALRWEAGMPWPLDSEMAEGDAALLRSAWERDLNCHRSSAAGRVFDAVAALLDLVREVSFEGQGPMYLEALAAHAGTTEAVALPLAQDDAGLWITDWAPLLALLDDPARAPVEKAASAHESLARAILAQAVTLREREPVDAVALSGGVFQNRLLAERTLALLDAEGFAAHLGERIPCNDAGLSFGQVVEYAAATSNPS